MSETKVVKETTAAYELAPLPIGTIELPPEFAWLRWLTSDEQSAFLHALLETLARTWQSSDVTLLKQEVERWQRQAQERRAARVQTERQAFWSRHEPRPGRQRALIDELLQTTASSMDTAFSVSEVRALLGQHIYPSTRNYPTRLSPCATKSHESFGCG